MRSSHYVLRWTIALGVIAPAILAATSYALQAAWWDSLPTVVPHHWNAAGEPDEFGSRSSFPIATTVLALALPALVMSFALPGLLRGRRGPSYRALTALALGMAVLGAVFTTGSAWLHRGVAEGGPWPTTTPVNLAAFAAAVIFGTAAYFVQPRQEVVRPDAHTRAPLALGNQERAVWMGSATISARWRTLLAVIAGGLLFWAIGLFAAGEVAVAVLMLATLAFVAFASAIATSFRVTIDHDGLTAASVVGWPRFVVPAEDVDRAAVVMVDGLGEFGGFGIRSTRSARGIIMRNGEALEVTRRSGKRLVITVDDAETGAALLMTFAQRAQSDPTVT